MNFENRIKTEAPAFSIFKLNTFINDYDAYYKENFGWRTLLFNEYGDFKFKVLNESPLPDKAYVGKKGWLFLGNSFGDGVKESLGIIQFNKKELKDVKNRLLQNKKFLDSLNISYYFMVAPNKQSIYYTYLPYSIKNQRTKLDQLANEMSANSDLKILDLKSVLLSKKDSAELYYKTDTHWNQKGAFIAYRAIMNLVCKDFPEVKPLVITDFNIKDTLKNSMDISKMMNQKVGEVIYDFQLIVKEKAVKQKNVFPIPSSYSGIPEHYETRFKNSSRPLKVLVFRDSFFGPLVKFVKETFGETIYVWQPGLNHEFIKNEKPDIVIQEIVERDIDLLVQ